MNIVMILDNAFHPDVRVFKEASFFIERGHHVDILCYDGRGAFLDKKEDNINGIHVKRYYFRTKIGTFFTDKISFKFHYFFYVLWLFKFFFACRKYVKNNTADFIYSHDLICGFMSTLFFRKYKKVFDMHESYKKGRNDRIRNNITEKFLHFTQRKSNIIIYVNEVQKHFADRKSLSKFISLPNYPILKDYETGKNDNHRFTVSYIGVIRKDDLILNLCEAAADLDCSVEIHGMGLKDLSAQKVNTYKNAHYYGAFDGTVNAKKLFRNCDLLYSVYDINNLNWRMAFPVKFFEAMASGTPVIASKDSSYGKLVEEKNIGYTVEWNNIKAIRETILCSIKNKDEYEVKRSNCINLKNEYSWEGKINELIDYMEQKV